LAAAALSAAAGEPVQEGSPTLAVPAATAYEMPMTRFERARILGARALQISLGAPILIDVAPTLVDPVEIAEREFEAGRIPITVRRGPAR
jgi:DNA-directed RNA polymerase subunit K